MWYTTKLVATWPKCKIAGSSIYVTLESCKARIPLYHCVMLYSRQGNKRTTKVYMIKTKCARTICIFLPTI